MNSDLIAVLDVGKTHAKLLLVEADSGEITWERQRVCAPLAGPHYRELDVAGTESWLIEALAAAPERARIQHIVPVAHGAAAVLVDAGGQPLAALDYEDPGIEVASQAYNWLRDRFSDTYSPSLPQGLNLGRQWYFLQTCHPALWKRAHAALLYPQYWAWRLSGVAASELTSLGCHTDLWRPSPSRPSDLAIRQGWDHLLPALHAAGEVLGLITPAIAQATGLSSQCQVYCGIHDSNAAYLCHLAVQGNMHAATARAAGPFSVISSGTWTIVLAQGAPLSNLQERLDMLANIDAYGHPVATARFMGGREYAQIAGPEARAAVPDRQALDNLLAKGAAALPSFASRGGPFSGCEGKLLNLDGDETAVERATLATLYTALMSDLLLDHLGALGTVIVDGPLTLNPLFARILQTLRPQGPVFTGDTPHGAAAAARYLVTAAAPSVKREACAPLLSDSAALARHRNMWRSRVTDLLPS
jgi:sugar (pentulose or hexulose) kinase